MDKPKQLYDYMCKRCKIVMKARFTPQVCLGCGASNSFVRYEPFKIKGLTQQMNKISKQEGEN